MNKQFAIITALAALLLSGCADDITGTDKLIRIISRGTQPNRSRPFFRTRIFQPRSKQYEVQYSGKILFRRDKEYCAAGTADKRAALGLRSRRPWDSTVTLTFKGGTEVIGLPYGYRPVYNGKFICYDISLEDFMSELQKSASSFYTDSGRCEEYRTVLLARLQHTRYAMPGSGRSA